MSLWTLAPSAARAGTAVSDSSRQSRVGLMVSPPAGLYLMKHRITYPVPWDRDGQPRLGPEAEPMAGHLVAADRPFPQRGQPVASDRSHGRGAAAPLSLSADLGTMGADLHPPGCMRRRARRRESRPPRKD